VTAMLRVEGVSKAFGGVQALSDCTIEVEQGSITGLIGPNGSGKTTLFNTMTGYERVDVGQVYLSDRKITNLRPQRVFALGIGRTFQLTRIFPRLTGPATRWPARAGGPTGAGPRTCSSSPASPATPTRWPRPCPTGSASCSSCRTCWSRTRTSCCSTSRRAG
jgi:energy-coupling factor transporter ATP-binding protein EcfA2